MRNKYGILPIEFDLSSYSSGELLDYTSDDTLQKLVNDIIECFETKKLAFFDIITQLNYVHRGISEIVKSEDLYSVALNTYGLSYFTISIYTDSKKIEFAEGEY